MFMPILANFLESPVQIFALCLVALLIFGHKLPGLARSLGSSVSEFKKGVKAGEEEANNAPAAPPEKTPAPEEKK